MVFTLVSSVDDDVKWKSAIERALGTWESVVEWADYISFLARVQKAVKNKHRCDGAKLPLASQISELLAQCLDPSLPAGVHQMCIDVYDTIFGILGPEKLAETIGTWLPGLLPVVSWAAFNVKPLLLTLLSTRVAPATLSNPQTAKHLCKPLLLALLPSIEEEGGDCFAEVLELLNTLKKSQTKDYFWQNLYLCVLTSSDVRMGSLTYMQRNDPLTNDEAGYFVRAVCCGLEDKNVLVQRGFLDLLARTLPLSSQYLQSRTADLDRLLLSACKTIFRRDMSLNRRLRRWLSEPTESMEPNKIHGESNEPNSGEPDKPSGVSISLEYIQKFVSKRLIAVLLAELETDAVSACTIAQGLSDRWELGAVLAPALLTPVLRCSRQLGTVPPAFAAFFDNVDRAVVWDTVLSLLNNDDTETVTFMVANYNIHDEEMLAVHVPLVALFILDQPLSPEREALVCSLLATLPPQDLPSTPPPAESGISFSKTVPEFFKKSYESSLQGESCELPVVGRKCVSWYLAKLAGDAFLLGHSAKLLNSVLTLFPPTPGMHIEVPQAALLVEKLVNGEEQLHSSIELFNHLVPSIPPLELRKFVQNLVSSLARTLTTDGVNQMEKVADLWQVHSVVGGAVVPSAVSAVIADSRMPALARARVFAGLWAFSADQSGLEMLAKPALLFLDLARTDSVVFNAYVQSGIVRTGTAHRFVKLLVDLLDAEGQSGDARVLSYILERFLVALAHSEIRSVYITRFAPIMCTLLLEWFDVGSLARATNNESAQLAYAQALELAELTALDPKSKDGKVWLRRFVDALIGTYDGGEAANGVPVALMRFLTAATPFLKQVEDVRVFAAVSVRNLETEVEFEAYAALLTALLAATDLVEEDLLMCIVARLAKTNCNAESGTQENAILHLLSALEQILVTAFKQLKDSSSTQQPPQSTGLTGGLAGSLTGAIAGFHLESPEDRTQAAEDELALNRCVRAAVEQSCRYWLFQQQTRAGHPSSTALHSTGRLKTRLRKLMFLCHTARPLETLKYVAEFIEDPKQAVRMVHMFEGSRQKLSLELLLKLAVDENLFLFAAAYVNSLETDLLNDIWPQIQQFLVTAASSSDVEVQRRALQFAVVDLVPRIERMRFGKRPLKEFGDCYGKLLMAVAEDKKDSVVINAIKHLPLVTEPEPQAQLLHKLLAHIKSSSDAAADSELLDSVSHTFVLAGSPPVKVWSKIVGDFVLDAEDGVALPVALSGAKSLMPVVDAWALCDKERLREFMAKLATHGAGNVLFGWSGTQAIANANLRRLSYILVSCAPSSLVINWSKLTTQLTALWTQSGPAVLKLLRACVLHRITPSVVSFMTFRLQTVFADALNREELATGTDAQLLLEACKLLDLVLALGLEEFQVFEWLFVGEGGDDDGENGVLARLAQSKVVPKTLHQLLTPHTPYRGAVRPLLPPRAQFADLPAFLAQASLAAHENAFAAAVPDVDFCREWVLSDLFD